MKIIRVTRRRTAAAEGTLVASYNRGIKLLNLCGGPKCTVMRDAMQRAPVFVFEDARGARDEDDPQVIIELKDLCDSINAKKPKRHQA